VNRVKNHQELLAHGEGELRLARQILLEAIENALEAANPKRAIRDFLEIENGNLRIGGEIFKIKGRIFVLSLGKAALAMMEAAQEKLGKLVSYGLCIVPRGQGKKGDRIEVIEAGHPLPDEGSLAAGQRILKLSRHLQQDDIVLCLISGGGSAMLELPPPGISLEDLRITNELLLKCGADIHSVNTVRKHLSLIKGGQMRRLLYPCWVFSLMISDVPGDVKHVIASGPTEPDPTTFKEAFEVLERYGIWDKLPQSVRVWVERGVKGEVEETPKPGEMIFERYRSWIVASNSLSLKSAAKIGEKYGFRVFLSELRGEAREMGAKIAENLEKGFYLWGGETTVTVRGPGKGGRNQELVLAACSYLDGRNSAMFSIGTDGIDGQTDAAGAVADGLTLQRARKIGLNPEEFLERNDSYHFFKSLGDLIFTGPTGTNVMDIAGLINL
jgi:glycerate-2-kinase